MGADRYDVVIVGGGHNGLVAAAYLASATFRPIGAWSCTARTVTERQARRGVQNA